MTRDHSLPLRRALVTFLRADATISTAVAARIYGEKVPAEPEWPFIRVNPMTAEPAHGSCYGGSTIDFSISLFTKGNDASSGGAIAARIVQILDEAELTLEGGAWTNPISWVRTLTLADEADASAWHHFILFSAVTGEDAPA